MGATTSVRTLIASLFFVYALHLSISLTSIWMRSTVFARRNTKACKPANPLVYTRVQSSGTTWTFRDDEPLNAIFIQSNLQFSSCYCCRCCRDQYIWSVVLLQIMDFAMVWSIRPKPIIPLLSIEAGETMSRSANNGDIINGSLSRPHACRRLLMRVRGVKNRHCFLSGVHCLCAGCGVVSWTMVVCIDFYYTCNNSGVSPNSCVQLCMCVRQHSLFYSTLPINKVCRMARAMQINMLHRHWVYFLRGV